MPKLKANYSNAQVKQWDIFLDLELWYGYAGVGGGAGIMWLGVRDVKKGVPGLMCGKAVSINGITLNV